MSKVNKNRRNKIMSRTALAVVAAGLTSVSANAQQADQSLPTVDVIQQAPKAQRSTSTRRQAISPAPRPVSAPAPAATIDFEEVPEGPRRDTDGRVVENAPSINPVNPTTTLPADLQGYAGAGSRITTDDINEQRPYNNHEALARVPGIVTINDDGAARQGGIGVRGSPVRRSRKVLILEDGDSINFSSYIDPSSHYTPPAERVEGIEVIRGTSISNGPITNHGTVNFFNLSPFGTPETVISGSIGHTEGSKDSVNHTRHIHHRNQFDNVGIVMSYTGADLSGAWDNERATYEDFYAAIGFKGRKHDLVISGVYHDQEDRYDEANFTPEEFETFGRKKSKGDPNSDFNNYNSEIFRLQAVHNYYIDADTTWTNRLYGFRNDRPRFEADSDYADDDNPQKGEPFVMEGRDRLYEHVGAESRIELANRSFFAGLRQDFQAGIRYEFHEFSNRTTIGEEFEKLDFDNRGSLDDLDQEYEANAFSAFVQTAIHLRPDFTLTPGVRFEYYDVERLTKLGEPSDAEDEVDAPLNEKVDFDNVLPGIGFAWKAQPKTTVYGGIHRGHTPHVARGELFPLQNEIGVNSQIGVRSTDIRGITLDAAVFHSVIENYQIKEPFTAANDQNVFGTVDEVEFTGFELYARIDSRPFTGGALNFFGEAIYTFADGVITESSDPTEVNNLVPEVPRQFANLTVGVEHQAGWNASVTLAYRGSFFTDTANNGPLQCEFEDGTPDGNCSNSDDVDEVIGGKVDGQWLLSARANYKVPDSNATVFVSGQNLTDELYVTDLADGIKPGQGRTVMTGVSFRFDHAKDKPLEALK